MKAATTIFQELTLLDRLLFKPCGLPLTNVTPEPESADYFAHEFQVAGKNVKFRKAKITPTKTGQFVTIWKRNENNITIPYSLTDDIDFYIFLTRRGEKAGIFLFPKSVMHENKILTDDTRDGKRGFRLYPPWGAPTNKQALNTQAWQTPYFINLTDETRFDLQPLKVLFAVST